MIENAGKGSPSVQSSYGEKIEKGQRCRNGGKIGEGIPLSQGKSGSRKPQTAAREKNKAFFPEGEGCEVKRHGKTVEPAGE